MGLELVERRLAIRQRRLARRQRVTAELRGEPKTEMWWLLDAAKGAELFAGFRRGTTRAEFERALTAGGASIREPTDQTYGDRTAAVKDRWPKDDGVTR